MSERVVDAPLAGADRVASPWAAVDRALNGLLHGIEHFNGAVLAVDVSIVFMSVVFRYFLHHPLDWVEEIASAGTSTMVTRSAGIFASVAGSMSEPGRVQPTKCARSKTSSAFTPAPAFSATASSRNS